MTTINGNINPDVENPVTSLELVKLLLIHMRHNHPVMLWGVLGYRQNPSRSATLRADDARDTFRS